MEYRTQIISPPPNSAVAFFERLNEASVRYGVFKSSRNTLMALAGDQDLDILVAREDYHRFCAIASDCAGIRSVNHRSLVSPSREDWFIPDFERGKYLHLDVHTNIRLGGKFDKRYPCFSYDDIRQWDTVSIGRGSVPIASPQDEAAITLARIAFRSRTQVAGGWQKLTGDWAREIDELVLAAEAVEGSIEHERPGLKFQCRVMKRGGEVWVHSADLASIRRAVRAYCAAPVRAAVTDPMLNALKAWRYAVSRFVNRLAPGLTIDRRRPAGGGLIIALVAPDGMGKSTQVNRMSRLFGWKFCCTRLYLGTGDGHGWWLRRLLRTAYVRRRSQVKANILNDHETQASARGIKSRIVSVLLSFWGLLTALERFVHVRAARRMAARGVIVICDRWPQSIQPGFMDGPTPERRGSRGLFRRWELSLYDRMSPIQPDVAIHLVGTYEVSQARKPGELTREAFDKRISLMNEMRARAPNTHVVNAADDLDDVSRSLFGVIWKAL